METNKKINKNEEYSELLTVENITNIIKSRELQNTSDNIYEIRVNENLVKINALIGSGGSKEVYDITLGEKHYALGINGIVDIPEIIIRKWKEVLKEPENTYKLKKLGLITNNCCKIVPITLNGYEFPAIIMKRYSNHDFKIYDSKNNNHNTNPLIGIDDEIYLEKAISFFSEITKEISILINNNIQLGSDSFNLCVLDDNMQHLYFNDLGSVSFNEIPEKCKPKYVRSYVISALDSFFGSFSSEVYFGNRFLKELDNLDGGLNKKLEEIVMSLI